MSRDLRSRLLAAVTSKKSCPACSGVPALESLEKSENTENTVVFPVFRDLPNDFNSRTREHQEHPKNESSKLSAKLWRDLDALEVECPAYVEAKRWRQAVEDGRRFLAEWGEKAVALGWTANDLFGLAPIPTALKPSFERLSRYDLTGLVWLLSGRRVIAMTDSTAAIGTASGGNLTYRRHSKPALGPLGDSLDDFQLGGGTGQ
jgi:hypothetical protein